MLVSKALSELRKVKDVSLPVVIYDRDENSVTAIEGCVKYNNNTIDFEVFGGVVNSMNVEEMIEQFEFFNGSEELYFNGLIVTDIDITVVNEGRIDFEINQ